MRRIVSRITSPSIVSSEEPQVAVTFLPFVGMVLVSTVSMEGWDEQQWTKLGELTGGDHPAHPNRFYPGDKLSQYWDSPAVASATDADPPTSQDVGELTARFMIA